MHAHGTRRPGMRRPLEPAAPPDADCCAAAALLPQDRRPLAAAPGSAAAPSALRGRVLAPAGAATPATELSAGRGPSPTAAGSRCGAGGATSAACAADGWLPEL